MATTTHVKLYKSRGNWRWRMTDSRNGKIIGASSEGYKRKVDMIKNLARVGNAAVNVSDNYKA